MANMTLYIGLSHRGFIARRMPSAPFSRSPGLQPGNKNRLEEPPAAGERRTKRPSELKPGESEPSCTAPPLPQEKDWLQQLLSPRKDSWQDRSSVGLLTCAEGHLESAKLRNARPVDGPCAHGVRLGACVEVQGEFSRKDSGCCGTGKQFGMLRGPPAGRTALFRDSTTTSPTAFTISEPKG